MRWDATRGCLAAALLGVALGVSGPPREVALLAFAVPALSTWIVENGARSPAPARAGFLRGMVLGAAANAVALYWSIDLLREFARFTLAPALAVSALLWLAQGLAFGLAASAATLLVARRVRSGEEGAAWWITPICLALALSLTPSIFPWRLSTPIISLTPFVQIADLGGETLIDLAMGLISSGLLEGALRKRPRPLALAVVALIAVLAYGHWRLHSIEEAREAAPALAVGVVQPNVGIHEKHDTTLWEGHLRALQGLTRAVEEEGAALTLWPETSYPYYFPRESRSDTPRPFSLLGGGARGPLLAGALTRRGDRRWNSAVAIERDGRVVGIADKVVLLAFGEYVPFREQLPLLAKRFRRGLEAGPAPEIIEISGARIGVLICYEDILPGLTREVAQRGPNLLVNLTNDAWFGDTDEPFQHHALARYRAIETRRDLVRAVNTGVSAHTLATGEEPFRTMTWQRESFVAYTRLLDIETVWTRFGDLVTPSLAGALAGALLAHRVRRRSIVRAADV